MDWILKSTGPLEKIFKDIVHPSGRVFLGVVHALFTLNRISRIKEVVLKSENGTVI